MVDEQRIPSEDELAEAMASVDQQLEALETKLRPLAIQKKALLRQKLRRLDEILRQRHEIADQLATLEDVYPDEGSTSLESKIGSSTEATDKPYASMTGWEAARAVLRDVGHPMRTGEIAQRVVAGGKKIANPVSSKLSSMMAQRDDVFYADMDRHKKMWGLIEWAREGRG